MQKHERQCLKVAEDLLRPIGFTIDTIHNGKAKLVIVANGHGITDQKIVSSSPGDPMIDIQRTRQWAGRLRKRVES